MDRILEGKALLTSGLTECCVGIEDGRIVQLKKTIPGKKEKVKGIMLPAAIDSHVHFRDPGFDHKEDFRTGTASAAFGGVSCVLDMPNTFPPVTSVRALAAKEKRLSKRAFVDFGLYAGMSDCTHLEDFVGKAIAFKLFLGTTTGEMLVTDDAVLLNLLEQARKTGMVVAVHAEDEPMLQKHVHKDISLEGHMRSRPAEAEQRAIQKVHRLSTDTLIHICHLSSDHNLELVKETGYSFEVTPHHLFLNSKMPLAGMGKVNPPLRSAEDNHALWHAFANGDIPIIASDHAPHTLEEKSRDWADVPSGIPGTETMLPLLLAKVDEGAVNLERVVDSVARKPSFLFGLNKGEIAEGIDADITVVDMKRLVKIKVANLHSKCGWTPFEGMKAIFPTHTMVRGEWIVEDGELVGDAGYGEVQLPTQFSE